MTRDQMIPALFAALVHEGVDPGLVERAVGRVLDIQLGESVTGGAPLLRAFAFEQAQTPRRGRPSPRTRRHADSAARRLRLSTPDDQEPPE